MTESVRCKDCGYLAIRNYRSRQLMEVEREFRSNWSLPQHDDGTGPTRVKHPVYVFKPLCFRMKAEFETEMAACQDGLPRDVVGVIEKQRRCDSFTKWNQGWTPREHLEMDLLQEQRIRDEVRNQTLLDNQQKFQDAQAKLADERHAESMRIATTAATTSAKAAKDAAWIGAIAAIVAAVLATILGIVLSRQSQSVVNNPIVQSQTPIATPATTTIAPASEPVPASPPDALAPENKTKP